jgi:N-acyl-D-aspartate/D-glutamate deacylase
MKGISKQFPGVKALDSVDFELFPGEVHALVGENGAGKSTLMKVLIGMYRADGGEITFKGRPFQAHNPKDAQERGISDFDAACAIAAEAGLKVGLVRLSYDLEDEWTDNARIEVLKDPRVVLGASDGGAHMDMMVGSDFPTRCLGELVRDRGVFTLEEMIRQFTDLPAQLYGLRDRGRLVPGHWADIVIFDPAKVDAGPLRTVTDLPANGSRLMTRPIGVRHVLVAGEELIRDGEPTAARAGQLLRSGKDTATVFAREEVVA